MVSNYVTWEVHDGIRVSFWWDFWNGQPPFSNSPNINDVMRISIDCWGSKLVDYVDAVKLFSGKVLWKDPSELPLDNQQKAC